MYELVVKNLTNEPVLSKVDDMIYKIDRGGETTINLCGSKTSLLLWDAVERRFKKFSILSNTDYLIVRTDQGLLTLAHEK